MGHHYYTYEQTVKSHYKRMYYGKERSCDATLTIGGNSEAELEVKRQALRDGLAQSVKIYKGYDARLDFGKVKKVK